MNKSQASLNEQEQLAREFVPFAIESGVLRFGQFKTKAGRMSPYFFNAGLFDDGAKLGRLAQFYARALLASGIEFDMIFGPAYKGIPLASATAIALAAQGRNVPIAFNRKEIKAHGEGGTLIGAALHGRVLIVDDVITAGTAVRESIDLIHTAGAQVCGVLVALDRQERGESGLSATQEISQTHHIPVIAIARLEDLLTYTGTNPALAEHQARLVAYRAQYGVS